MNTNVNLNLDPVAFYQQKVLLFDLRDKFYDTYGESCQDLLEMIDGAIAIFDEIGDQAEDQGEFTYPYGRDDGSGFEDERYNDVLKKLIAGKPLNEPMSTTSSQIVDATFTSNWDDGSYFDAPCKVDLFTHRVFNIGCAGCPSEDAQLENETVTIDGGTYPCINADDIIDWDDKEETSVFTDDAYWYGDKNPRYGCLSKKED